MIGKLPLEGAMLYGLASYAARTFPCPKNIYGKWALGILQYALSNPDLANKNFKDEDHASLSGK